MCVDVSTGVCVMNIFDQMLHSEQWKLFWEEHQGPLTLQQFASVSVSVGR